MLIVGLDLVELAHEGVRIIRSGRHLVRLEFNLRRSTAVLLLGRAHAADGMLAEVDVLGALVLILEHGIVGGAAAAR